jgi:hypothetical protein
VALHTHNRTPLGAWITTQLENERQQHLARTGDELKAGLLDAVLTLCNLRIKLNQCNRRNGCITGLSENAF